MTSQSPPNYYFNGIIFNSSFYNKSSSTNGITKSQLNTALSQYLPLANTTSVLNMNNQQIKNISNATASQDCVSLSQLQTYLPLSGGAITGDITLSNSGIIPSLSTTYYSTTLNGNTTQLGGYATATGTVSSIVSNTATYLTSITVAPGIHIINAFNDVINNGSSAATVSRFRFIVSLTSASTVAVNNSSVISFQQGGTTLNTGSQIDLPFSFLYVNSSGSNATLYLNSNIVYTGTTPIVAVLGILSSVRII